MIGFVLALHTALTNFSMLWTSFIDSSDRLAVDIDKRQEYEIKKMGFFYKASKLLFLASILLVIVMHVLSVYNPVPEPR